MKIRTKLAIIIPKKDTAAINIWRTLQEQSFFKESVNSFDDNAVYNYEKAPNDIKVVFAERDGVEITHLEESIEADFFIYASRHRSASGIPALLIHAPGNWDEITLAGREKELSFTSAFMLKIGLMKLKEKQESHKLEEFKVDFEVTHHGPTNMRTPLCFMELGSSEKYWADMKGATAVGEAILETAEIVVNKGYSFSGNSYIGFGGNHYAYRFHKHLVQNEGDYFGHIAPKHAIETLTKNTIQQALEKTIEKPQVALIDKKGANSPQKKKVIEIVESIGKEYAYI